MTLQERISTYKKQNYNKWFWWRRFQSAKNPLHKYRRLNEKIANGDYEVSDYHWWVMWENELEKEALVGVSCPDKQHEIRCLFGERRRRLTADYEKDEAKILELMYKDFKVELGMTQEEVEEEMLQFDGTLSEFYSYIYSKKKQNGN